MAEGERTTLYYAVDVGMYEAAQMQLSRGAKVHATLAEGIWPVHLAVRSGSVKMMEIILPPQPSIDIRTEDQENPLYWEL
ncbi:Ankyrin-1 [Paramyrothecium foliicola]|nr:Ankyrin-1 [Paramyrothecium foliicola]